MKYKRVHIGKIIEQKTIEYQISQAALGRLLDIKRQNIKKTIFEKHSLDTDLLMRISEVLDFDLFQYYRPCNKKDYKKEIKASLTIEIGKEKIERLFRFFVDTQDTTELF